MKIGLVGMGRMGAGIRERLRCAGHEVVDALYGRAMHAGHSPQASPRDAEWRERYFHLRDPDGHELSFAAPLATAASHGGRASR